MKITCVIIDDEPLAIKVLESHIQNIEFLDIKATFANAIEANTYLQHCKVDLIFLDINMPRLTGLEFLKILSDPPKVILTTAYREFALDGYEHNVTDYLLKPISFDRLLKAVNKVLPGSESIPAGRTQPAMAEHIFLKSNKKMVKVDLEEILYIESIKDYVKVKTLSREIITYQRLSNMEEMLPSNRFLRIHKSFIINMQNIDSYSASGVEINKYELPFGRLFKDEAMKVLEGFGLRK